MSRFLRIIAAALVMSFLICSASFADAAAKGAKAKNSVLKSAAEKAAAEKAAEIIDKVSELDDLLSHIKDSDARNVFEKVLDMFYRGAKHSGTKVALTDLERVGGKVASFKVSDENISKVDVFYLDSLGESLEKYAEYDAADHKTAAREITDAKGNVIGYAYEAFNAANGKEYFTSTSLFETKDSGHYIKFVLTLKTKRVKIGDSGLSMCIPATMKKVDIGNVLAPEFVKEFGSDVKAAYAKGPYGFINGIIIYEGKLPKGETEAPSIVKTARRFNELLTPVTYNGKQLYKLENVDITDDDNYVVKYNFFKGGKYYTVEINLPISHYTTCYSLADSIK